MDKENYQKYEEKFLSKTNIEWEIKTYKTTIIDIKKLLGIEL